MDWLIRLRNKLLPGMRKLAGRGADPETEIRVCLREHVRPALEVVRDDLANKGFETSIAYGDDDSATLAATNFNGLPLQYTARGHVYKEAVVNMASMADASQLHHYPMIEIESGGKTREYRPGRCDHQAIERAVRAYFHTFLMRTPEGD